MDSEQLCFITIQVTTDWHFGVMESFDASFKKNLDESPKRFKTTHKTKKTKNQNGKDIR